MAHNLFDVPVDAAGGSGAALLLSNGMDPHMLRPWVGGDGRAYVSRLKEDGKTRVAVPLNNVSNASGFLRKGDWEVIDRAVVKVALPRLRAVADLRDLGLELVVPNGLGRMVLETETQSDISEAMVSLGGTRKSMDDRPEFGLTPLPLPVVHKDFKYDLRQVAASRNGGSPLDTATAEAAARKVSEMVEQMYIGTAPSFAYQTGTVYGLTNFPSRLTKVQVAPTAGGWTPDTTIKEVLDMRKQLQKTAKHFGPYHLYTSLSWDVYLDDDYKATNTQPITLRERLEKIKGIKKVETLDYLPDNTMVLVQMSSDVVRIVVGMDIMTIQWETQGGMELNFKVMAIMTPQLRADFNGNSGIMHGTHP